MFPLLPVGVLALSSDLTDLFRVAIQKQLCPYRYAGRVSPGLTLLTLGPLDNKPAGTGGGRSMPPFPSG